MKLPPEEQEGRGPGEIHLERERAKAPLQGCEIVLEVLVDLLVGKRRPRFGRCPETGDLRVLPQRDERSEKHRCREQDRQVHRGEHASEGSLGPIEDGREEEHHVGEQGDGRCCRDDAADRLRMAV